MNKNWEEIKEKCQSNYLIDSSDVGFLEVNNKKFSDNAFTANIRMFSNAAVGLTDNAKHYAEKGLKYSLKSLEKKPKKGTLNSVMPIESHYEAKSNIALFKSFLYELEEMDLLQELFGQVNEQLDYCIDNKKSRNIPYLMLELISIGIRLKKYDKCKELIDEYKIKSKKQKKYYDAEAVIDQLDLRLLIITKLISKDADSKNIDSEFDEFLELINQDFKFIRIGNFRSDYSSIYDTVYLYYLYKNWDIKPFEMIKIISGVNE